VILFVILSLASCFLYWKFIRHARDALTDQPLLNRRAEQYVGRRYVLDSAIVNGHGKARVGDSLWLVEGPELPAGSPIEVISVDGTTLKVQKAV
jgi:membrane protein implicated in regulation of membrane protease activity